MTRKWQHRSAWLWMLAGMLWLPAAVIVAQTSEPVSPLPGLTIHVVQRDENLFRIALAYNTTVEYLVEINGIASPGNIQVGQRLLVPTGEAATPIPQTHTVQPGETLTGIAALYHVTVNDLLALNNIGSPNQIYPGQILQIGKAEAAGGSATPFPTAQLTVTPDLASTGTPLIGSTIHTVQEGETLFRIATQYNLTVNDLAAANNITDPTLIYAGQQLIIPGAATEPTALDLPVPIISLAIKPLMFVEGETGSIQLITSSPATVTGTFLSKDLNVISDENNTRHTMLIGVPMFTEAGIYPVALNVLSSAGKITCAFNIRVLAGGYGSQNINVSADLAPLLAPAPQEYELDLLTRVTTPVTPQRYYTGAFGLPAAAAMNSPFGTRRSYNGGEATTFHTGADFASAPGAPVFAAAPGKVVLADLLNIRGNTIVLDHGWGVYTVYCHLSEINIQLGQMAATGQIIGAAGSTGRITGPHLHWEVWVNGIPVNPLQWLTMVFP